MKKFKWVLSKKIETANFKPENYSKRLLLTVYRHKNKANTYTIYIATFIKQDLDSIKKDLENIKQPNSAYKMLIEDKISLIYNKNNPLVNIKPNKPHKE